MNFLEQLTFERYSFQGYFVKHNLRYAKLNQGGWKHELDIFAYHPANKKIVHVETSTDAKSWEDRKAYFVLQKFNLTMDDYRALSGNKQLETVDKIVIAGSGKSTSCSLDWGKDITVILIPSYLKAISKHLKEIDPLKEAVSENFVILRGIQFALWAID